MGKNDRVSSKLEKDWWWAGFGLKIWLRFHCLHQKLDWNPNLLCFGPLFLNELCLRLSRVIEYISLEMFQSLNSTNSKLGQSPLTVDNTDIY